MPNLSIEGLLEYYHQQVSDDLALTYNIAEDFPIEILNEVRNALGHISRASLLEADSNERQEQLKKAKNHFLRVRLDCAKLNLLSGLEKLDNDLEVLIQNTELPKSLLDQAKGFKDRRSDLIGAEVNGPNDEIVEGFLTLYEDIDNFLDLLRSEYATLVHDAYHKEYQKKLEARFREGKKEGAQENLFRNIMAGVLAGFIIYVLTSLF